MVCFVVEFNSLYVVIHKPNHMWHAKVKEKRESDKDNEKDWGKRGKKGKKKKKKLTIFHNNLLDFVGGNHGERNDAKLRSVVTDDIVSDDHDVTNKSTRVGIAKTNFTDRFSRSDIPDDQGSLPTGDK